MGEQKPDDRTTSLPGSDALPTAQGGTIGRFVVDGALGAGGMGVVVAAHDPTLYRRVAIKLLRSVGSPAGNADAAAKLAREAQAMARVQHPNVTTVYEVGTVGDQLFVVMELVDGQTLKAWMHERPRTEREIVDMFVAAGRGLEAVHVAGLVHRDFKPDNVLLGRDGRPRVSDFGLVRAPVAAGPPVAGEVSFTAPAGTPAYMAPEQFAGLGSDVRSDQFSFCVALYEAASGERPFAGGAPPSERRAPATTPRSWRASTRLYEIVARGLANDPEARWPSLSALIEALAEDRGARRRRVTAVVAAAVVLAVVTVGWLGARRNAAERVRTARALGQQVQQMRSRMRDAYLLPLHDTKPERDRVRAQMKSIADKMRALGDEGRGPGELALGSGYFALGDNTEARKHLEAAWAAGERSPELAYELGLVLGEAYRIAKANEPGSQTKEQRDARNRELERTLRDPALAYLQQSEGAPDTSPKYVAALIARWDRHYDEALRNADAALAEDPLLYEAALLSAEIQGERAVVAVHADDRARGLALMKDAEARFARALDIGRSDPRPLSVYADWLMGFSFISERIGQDSAPLLERAIEMCKRGQQASSEAKWPTIITANASWLLADSAVAHRRDPRPALKQATEAGERAVQLSPDNAFAYGNALGGAWLAQASDWDVPHGGDAGTSYQKAIDAYKTGNKIRDDVDGYNNLGLATAGLAAWRSARGEDVAALVDDAVAAFDHAHLLRADLHFMETGACDVLAAYARDRFERGLDFAAVADRADHYCAAARAGDPGVPEPFDESARVDAVRAEAAGRAGGDSAALWERAVRNEETALKLNPTFTIGHVNLAEIEARRAEYSMQHGGDGRAELARADKAAAEAARLEPDAADAYRAQALIALVRARAAAAHGDPTATIAVGVAACEHALAIKPDDVVALGRAAELRAIEARFRARRGQSSVAAVAAARALVARTLAINPRSPSAVATAAALDHLVAR